MISANALVEKFRYALDNDWGYIWGASGEKWTEEKQRQATREMTVKYGSRWIGHMVADCSGLFTWAFRQLGGQMYHGSNTMYRSWCTAKGKLPKSDIKIGTAVFTGTEDDHGHVGLYVGSGYVIEAATTEQGVIRSKLSAKKWTYWGELKGVDYSGNDPFPTLRKGAKGADVIKLQTLLQAHGFDIGKYGIDGDFGSATEKAVKSFQKAAGLKVDGIVGQNTWTALEANSAPARTYSVMIRGMTRDQADAFVSQFPGRVSIIDEGE